MENTNLLYFLPLSRLQLCLGNIFQICCQQKQNFAMDNHATWGLPCGKKDNLEGFFFCSFMLKKGGGGLTPYFIEYAS